MKSLPRAARGRGTAKRWKGRFERPYEQGLLHASKRLHATAPQPIPPPYFAQGWLPTVQEVLQADWQDA